jgi:hypothetical protein
MPQAPAPAEALLAVDPQALGVGHVAVVVHDAAAADDDACALEPSSGPKPPLSSSGPCLPFSWAMLRDGQPEGAPADSPVRLVPESSSLIRELSLMVQRRWHVLA